jgi:hypothetical protein
MQGDLHFRDGGPAVVPGGPDACRSGIASIWCHPPLPVRPGYRRSPVFFAPVFFACRAATKVTAMQQPRVANRHDALH